MNKAPAPRGRLYAGARGSAAGDARVGYRDGASIAPLDTALHIRNHSPDGFQWGYLGSGPAQLALALVYDATGNGGLAVRVYQRFKEEVIALITDDEWELSAGHVADFARMLDVDRKA